MHSIRRKTALDTKDSADVIRRADELSWLHDMLANIPSSEIPRLVAHRGELDVHQSILCQRSPPCRNSRPCDKNRKVHKMCARSRYGQIPDMKLRQVLGLGPIVSWFIPTPVLLSMMLPGWVWGFLVSTFVEGMGWLI